MSERFDFRNCDAMELLASIPDKSADCVITDPPYGTTGNDWDTAPDWGALVPELLRVSRGAVCVFSQLPVACDVIAAARDRYRLEWVWEKSRPGNFIWVRQKPLHAHENILVFANPGGYAYHPQMVKGEFRNSHASGKSGVSYLRQKDFKTVPITPAGSDRYPRDVLKYPSVSGGGIHPTQKPLELIRYLVRTYSDRGGSSSIPTRGAAPPARRAPWRNAASWGASLTRVTTPRPLSACASPTRKGGCSMIQPARR